jgi:hypothetical protein
MNPTTQKLWATGGMLVVIGIAIWGKGHVALVGSSLLGALISLTIPWPEPAKQQKREEFKQENMKE